MSITDVQDALRTTQKDESVGKSLIEIWPVAESILEAFAKATELPIFAYINGLHVFTSSVSTLPEFCNTLLSSSGLRSGCVADGARRATGLEPEFAPNRQFCYAGLLNGRVAIANPHIGELVILYGSRLSTHPDAAQRRSELLDKVRQTLPAVAETLEHTLPLATPIDGKDSDLMHAIAGILNQLLEATIDARAFALTMAHELSQMLLPIGLLSKQLTESLPAEEAKRIQPLLAEARLGLYIVNNFLSHLSERRYEQALKHVPSPVNMAHLVRDMIELYEPQAAMKDIEIEAFGLENLPSIRGYDLDLRRAVHNVLNNAIKYSYHSVSETKRIIRIRVRVHDPGFRKRRFAIIFNNYGLGLAPEEKPHALKAGFRGKQAQAEVPSGSGIGLSEVAKIMKRHGGEVKIDSRELHTTREGITTYLTIVELIFPY
jgi:signal transduction histidine kinase